MSVENIINLRWHQLRVSDLRVLMIVAAYCSVEFWSSLKALEEEHGENAGVRDVVGSERRGDGLTFEDFPHNNHSGFDGGHAEFLWHFINLSNLIEQIEINQLAVVLREGAFYEARVTSLPRKDRAATIVARERALPSIFSKILAAPAWNQVDSDDTALLAFQYFLKRHIEIDTAEDGHQDALAEIECHPEQVKQFWDWRYALYTKTLERLN